MSFSRFCLEISINQGPCICIFEVSHLLNLFVLVGVMFSSKSTISKPIRLSLFSSSKSVQTQTAPFWNRQMHLSLLSSSNANRKTTASWRPNLEAVHDMCSSAFAAR